MKRNILRIALVLLLITLIVVQFYPLDRSVPDYNQSNDFLTMQSGDEESLQLLKVACYDCHSYETNYPWYSKVAPTRLWVQNHIEAGREHLNFSLWGTYDFDRRKHKIEECIEEIEEEHMPLNSYTWMHSEADLSKDERDKLIAYFEKIK